jgi:hypothetical protein
MVKFPNRVCWGEYLPQIFHAKEVIMSAIGKRTKYVSCKIWDATRDDFTFPEIDDPKYKVAELESRPNVGLAFSGGGTRSASCVLGQLRGLKELNLLRNVRYLSCVSGGSWASVPFTYLNDNWTDEMFLGQVIPPRDLTVEALKKTDRNSFGHLISNSIIIDDFFGNVFRFAGDETFSRAIGDIFLEPLEIDSLKRSFSLNSVSVANILKKNPRLNEDDFYTVRAGRPFLIVNSTILRVDNPEELPRRIHFETTPLYAGARVFHAGAGSNGLNLGGGYIEPLGFDSDEPNDPPDNDQVVNVRLGASRHLYTLSDVAGTSGAAPAEVLAKFGLDWVGFPEFRHWSVPDTEKTRAKEYTFGDGGILENLGIMPLLMRKVERIVVFINTKSRLKGGGEDEINDSIRPLFGQTPLFSLNHVFPEDMYADLVENLLVKKEAGQTVMHKARYPVREAPHYGIEGGWEVDVLWVYNERVKEWEDRLPANIRKKIGTGSLGTFPHYRTFFQNPPKVIDLSATQVNLLAHLHCWNITVAENRPIFEDMLT